MPLRQWKEYKKCCLPKSGRALRAGAPSVKQQLELAAEHHLAGRRADALAICELLLLDDPRQAEALNLCGSGSRRKQGTPSSRSI